MSDFLNEPISLDDLNNLTYSKSSTPSLDFRSNNLLSGYDIDNAIKTTVDALTYNNSIIAKSNNNSNQSTTVPIELNSSASDSNTISVTASADSTVNQVAADLLALNSNTSTNKQVLSERKVVAYGLSEAEQAILTSSRPPQLNATEEISVNGERGLWTNKAEVVNWRGPISINRYEINQDSNPEVIRKQTDQQLTYVQDIAVRYLRPPTPPPPGEIIISQQANTVIPPAPPVVIRQAPPRPITPPPLVVREAPPQPPPRVGRKLINISGKVIPPPPRKVVVERLAPLPNKPQSVFVERWLPYNQVKRRVIFQKSNQVDPIVVKPRNVIVQWEAPKVQVRKELRNLGVIRANPNDYVQRYGASLRTVNQFPAIASSIRPPPGIVLAAEHKYNNLHELYGDVQALSLIDLEREGLGAYRGYLARLGVGQGSSYSSSSSSGISLSSGSFRSIIDDIFASIDRDSNGRVSIEEAQRVFLNLNSRLGRAYGEDDIRAFFAQLDVNQDGYIDFIEFRRAFDNLLV